MDQVWVFQEHRGMRADAVAEPRNCRMCFLLAAEECVQLGARFDCQFAFPSRTEVGLLFL